MRCYICDSGLRWEGDQDLELEEQDYLYSVITFLHCDNCDSHIEVYHPAELDLSSPEPVPGNESNRGYTPHGEIAPD